MICSDAAAQRTPLDDARDAILGAVTGSLLHSIGQPLTIIRLAAERAAPDTCMDAAAVEVVVGQVTRLETVFLHLDALARAGRGPVRAQPSCPRSALPWTFCGHWPRKPHQQWGCRQHQRLLTP